MKRFTLIILPITFAIVVAWAMIPPTNDSYEYLMELRKKHDPSKLTLEASYNSYVKSNSLPSGEEVGIVTCSDGTTIKYWFRSPHSCENKGGAIFEFPEGKIEYLEGWFCCEVQLPEEQLSSPSALKKFIDQRKK